MHVLISCKRHQSEHLVNYFHSCLNQNFLNPIIKSKRNNHTVFLSNELHIHLIITCIKLRLKHALALFSN